MRTLSYIPKEFHGLKPRRHKFPSFRHIHPAHFEMGRHKNSGQGNISKNFNSECRAGVVFHAIIIIHCLVSKIHIDIILFRRSLYVNT